MTSAGAPEACVSVAGATGSTSFRCPTRSGGQALEDYVLHGRGGRVEGGEVFWTVIDPVQPLSANGVCGKIRQICLKAGLEEFGPHRLPHPFATGMLASGATLEEVQGLLRHAHLRTTAIYTKVDKNRLTRLVPEWPAAASLGRRAR
jgi:site-specific recombinase XerD